MEYNTNLPPRQPNPRRRKRDPKRIFMESYLPVIVLAAVLLLVIVLIAVSCSNKNLLSEDARKESLARENFLKKQQAAYQKEADTALADAKAAADTYDFEGAIEILDGFSGNIYDFDEMLTLRDDCQQALENLIPYSPEEVVHLSVELLIADAQRAFSDKSNGSGYRKKFITTDEFSNMLLQLYNNGYVLVDMGDIVEQRKDEDGSTLFFAKSVSLPEGKKPFMLTQTQVNYYTYMVDPNGDGTPDADGAGFASKLILENGTFKNQMVTADGQTVTGNFDLVPILEDFIASHPDFTYHNARPILAVTGYNGIFGYRGEELSEVTPLLDALRSKGYTVAFCSYSNTDYQASTLAEVEKDIQRWNDNIVPVLGQTPCMVFARGTDIAIPGSYSSDKHTALQNQGFRYYLGFCTDGKPWFHIETSYVRQGRLVISAANLTDNPEWYTGLFDPATVLKEAR